MRWQDIQGWWAEGDAKFMETLVRSYPGGHFLEVGSWRGRSAAATSAAMAANENPGVHYRLDCVDTFQGSPPESDGGFHKKILEQQTQRDGKRADLALEFRDNLEQLGLRKRVVQRIGKGSEWAKLYAPVSLDVVMIDADHRRVAVAEDVRSWWPKVVPGGTLCGHDASNAEVIAGVKDALGKNVEISFHHACWAVRKPESGNPLPGNVGVPDTYPGRAYWLTWFAEGCRRLGVGIFEMPHLRDQSHWLEEGVAAFVNEGGPVSPLHVAALQVGQRRVWLDYSDWPKPYAEELGAVERGEAYWKIQCPAAVPYVRPAGQHLTDLRLLKNLETVRQHALQTTDLTTFAYTALFSNIDERWQQPGLRRNLVSLLRNSSLAGKGLSGLWRFNELRPPVPPELQGKALSYEDFLQAQAGAGVAFALPGVGGEFTRKHLEIWASGGRLSAPRFMQKLPGNPYYLDFPKAQMGVPLLKTVAYMNSEEASADRERCTHMSMHYYERWLTPERFAARILQS